MQFTLESGITFNSSSVDDLLTTRSNNQLLNEYARYFYRQYTHIRNCCNPRKCKNLYIETVRERMTEQPYKNFIENLLGFDIDQVNYILDFVEQHYKIK